MDVSGEIGIFEGQRACAPLQRHIFGRRRHLRWLWVLGILAFDFAGEWAFDTLVPGSGIIGILIASVIGLTLMIRASRRMAPQAWMRRGVPANSPASYHIEPAALVISTPHSQTRLNWTGLSEIIPGNDAWLFIGQGTAYFLPKRFFADPGAESAFLAACLDHMSPEARALSVQAARAAKTA